MSARLPSLDGWRAVSILLVLGAHCKEAYGFPSALAPLFIWLFDGDLGVRFFFIISGFLITWLLLLEKERSGKVNLGHFYARRALRILPVYFAFLGILALLQHFTPFHQPASAWIGNITFTTNYAQGVTWASGHLWSIAVEEQFYLAWPAIFLLANVSRIKPIFSKSLWVFAIPICIAPVVRVISYLHLWPHALQPLFTNYSFFKYMDSLAIGCACALVYSNRHAQLLHWLQPRFRLVPVCALFFILTPLILGRLFLMGIVTVPIGNSLQGLGIALLLLQSVLFPRFGFYGFLNTPALCQIGVLSYSIYIWQQIFCTNPETFGMSHVWWLSFPYWLLPVFVVSFVSFYGLERPFFRLRAYYR